MKTSKKIEHVYEYSVEELLKFFCDHLNSVGMNVPAGAVKLNVTDKGVEFVITEDLKAQESALQQRKVLKVFEKIGDATSTLGMPVTSATKLNKKSVN